ncbi:hypothetical protein DUI87_11916 [Hirundo rustica rustica]|uniref:ribonuclease H n=1 Tax=Hirundo rustica rustica TaxID=333673 RepID=A0A3M0KLG2_HIRRU|nr:hypothetical protein DUI87_11916 [Hirundo rustica rustica]
MYHRGEPIVNFEVGPQHEEYEFLVDTGADRSSIRRLPVGVNIGTRTCEVVGAEGKPFAASIIEGIEVKGNSKQIRADFIYLPDLESNLLGRDLQVLLGIGVIPEGGQMKVKIMKLTAGDIEEINPEVWAEGGKSGLLNIPPIEVKMQPGTPPIRIKQYPMSLEGKKGLIPIIEQLLKEGILEPCMSPHNTPILAVKKAEGKYRLVQDLREINKRTITKHPVVPNPYNLLSQIPQEHAWFTTIDLKDAFWACPLAEESRDWFAFEWDHPETKRRQQLRWTRLPQGFTESPNLFGQALERLLEQFTPEGQVQILQYVDDLLISGENQLEVRTTSIKLLNFLGEKGLKVSKRKLQFVKPEVTYLGHLIGKGYKKLSPERIAGIIAIPAPKTKRDIRKLLGLFGYCRHWIDEYTQNVRFLYDKLVSPEPIEWTQEDEKQLEKLKNKLSTAPVLSLPDLKKEFDLFVNTEGGVAYGVLAQEWGGCKKPIAFLSKILDPVARGWPACLQAVAATAVLVEESQKLTLNGKIQIHTPHDIKTVLSQKAPGWVTDSRILKYEITLINSEDLRLTVSKNLNPAQFLSGEPPPDLEHDCLELMSLQTKVREDLESTPLPYGKRLFTDGSSRVLEGKRVSGYAVVEGSTIEDIQVRETGKLPSSWSAQLCEIYAVKRGLDLLGGDRGTIYTDSKYAFGIVHTFGKIWEERGYLNSKGKDLVHKEMIRSVLTSLLKPIEIAVVHVKGHQKETTFEGKGNQLADKEAKRAAQDPKGSIRILALNETSEEEGGEEKPKYDRTELKAIKDLGMRKGEHGEWLTPDGRKFLNKPLARRILTEIHELTHWGTQGLCDHFLKENFCIGIYSIAKAITQGCTICQKVNQRIARKAIPGGRELALRPFQSIQIDFTEMPQIQGYKHLLVMVDHLTHWIEAFPTKKETAEVVVKILLEHIIPRYGLVNNIDSDRGTHFTAKILRQIVKELGINWRLHTPWHPQSSGRVERMNQTLKNVLTKLIEETQLNWLKCLPLALLRIRTRPRSDIGASPYEMMFGLPFLLTTYSTGEYIEGDTAARKYLQTISKTLENLRIKGYIPQTSPLDANVHQINPGDWVLIKSWSTTPLTPKFEGPFQVLLTTHTAVRTKERGWTHITRVKGPVSPPSEPPDLNQPADSSDWTVTPQLDPLKLTFKKKTKTQ